MNIFNNMSIEELKSRGNLSLKEIDLLIKDEKDVKIYKKLMYLRFKAMGMSTKESYQLAGIKKSSAYDLENKWKSGGYNALIPKPSSGRKTKLNNKQIEELKKELEIKDKWHPNEISDIIEDKWNIKYSYSGVKKLANTHFDIELLNSYEINNEKDKETLNIVENFNNLSEIDKKEINKIISYISEEKSVFVLKKLFYLLIRKIGFSNKITSYFLDVTPETGNNWKKQWEDNEYESLKRKKGQGRKKKLTQKEQKIIKKN